jgi:hypothetical protein
MCDSQVVETWGKFGGVCGPYRGGARLILNFHIEYRLIWLAGCYNYDSVVVNTMARMMAIMERFLVQFPLWTFFYFFYNSPFWDCLTTSMGLLQKAGWAHAWVFFKYLLYLVGGTRSQVSLL